MKTRKNQVSIDLNIVVPSENRDVALEFGRLAGQESLFDLETLSWNENILNEYNIPENSLPQIKPSLGNFGTCKYILENIPITAVLGDQQASLFGQQCFDRGSVKNTYGTGCFALSNTGDDIIYSNLNVNSSVLLIFNVFSFTNFIFFPSNSLT